MIESLLALQALIVTLGCLYMWRREKLFAAFLFFLYVYAVFAQLGYIYLPEYSRLILAYFGDEIINRSVVFVTLSFIAVIASFRVLSPFVRPVGGSCFALTRRNNLLLEQFSLLSIVLIFLFLLCYLYIQSDHINWYTAQDSDVLAADPIYVFFIFVFKCSVALVYILYVLVRARECRFPRPVVVSAFFFCAAVFLLVAFQLGNRTDVLAVTLGIVLFESTLPRGRVVGISRLIVIVVASAIALVAIEVTRYDDFMAVERFSDFLFLKDYFAPLHMLFAAISFDYIDPIEVLVSNATNSLFMFGHPYLQYSLTELFRPGVTSRSASYAFHVFAEGYIVMGMFGVIYNGIVLSALMAIWCRLAKMGDAPTNAFVVGLMGCMVVNLVRGQSSYFVKYLYTFIIPAAIIYGLLTGVRICIRRRFV